VQVFDGSGNKASNDFSVTRHIPSVMQTGNRMSITVLPFEAKQKTTELTGLANDYLTGSLTDQKRFNVIERAKLEQVLLEQKLTKSKLTDPEHSIRVGKLMSAEAILATSIKEDQKSVEIISRVINTETSQVMEVKDVFTEDKSASTVKELIDGLATKIALSFPLVEGMVIKKEDGTVYTDLGARSKIKKDSAVIVYRKGKEIKHPVTGKSLGFDTLKIAEGRFEDVQDDFSKAKILDKPALKEIQVKDLIVTK
jgi:TolB-like protein